MDEMLGTGAPAHEKFATHFTDPIYDDPAEEFAPFGSDEGADILAEWAERVDDLGTDSTVRDILRDSFEDPADLHDFLGGTQGGRPPRLGVVRLISGWPSNPRARG